MQIFRNSSAIPSNYFGSVVALGNFDGLHLGHQAVIQKTLLLAQQSGKSSGVLTFEPHPRHFFHPDFPPLRIIPFATKARLFQGMGIDFIRVIRFTRAFSTLTAQQFIANILVGELHICHVVTGSDFAFGNNREGNMDYMQKAAASLSFEATACPLVAAETGLYSSTRIREALAVGDVELAAQILGRPYSIKGRVQSGDKRGRELGFPTANIVPRGIFTPAYGVYAVKVQLRGKWVKGVANFGIRPTFSGLQPRLEVHLFEWHEEIYGESLEVILVKKIREEKKFDGIEALKTQIAEDCRKAHLILIDC
jgi:riboflavin kinase/FMN adenylyltransferase